MEILIIILELVIIGLLYILCIRKNEKGDFFIPEKESLGQKIVKRGIRNQ